MDGLEQAKIGIDSANNIGILTKNNANDDAIATTLALFFALKNIGKKVFFPIEQLPEKMLLLLKNKEQKKFHISFKEEVSEVYYEKRDNGIDLYVTPKNGDTDSEKFSCNTVSGLDYLTSGSSSDFDLLITVGIQDFSEVEELCEKNLDQLYACTIINIDNNLSNQNYGEINRIEDKESLSQNASCLIKYLGGEFLNKEAASFLLFGLTSSPENTTNKKNLPTVRWLFKHGGDLSILSKAEEKDHPPQMKILEAVLKNLTFLEDDNIYVSTISEDNMKESGAISRDLAFVVEKVKSFFKIPSFLLLWESHSSPIMVKGIFYSERKSLVERITNNYKGIFKGAGALFLTDESSIEAAKEKVLSNLLKK